VPGIDPDADNLTAALAYAEAGLYVLPVRRSTKNPGSILGKQWQRQSSRDPKVITAWFAGTGHDIALHCGRSGVVVFDVDRPAAVPDVLESHLSSAPYQSTRPGTPGRGHYMFAMPPGRIIGNGTGRLAGDWGEIRGANGVIIAANSHHSDGGEYRWQRTGSLSVLPCEIADLLPDASSAEDAATDEQVTAFLAEHTEASRPEIMHGWIHALHKQFESGSRHNGTVSVLTGTLKEARAGYFAAASAVDVLRPMFIAAATREPTGGEHQRTERQAADEWGGIMAWAVAQANAADLDEVHTRTEAKMSKNTSDIGEVTHSGHLGMAVKLGQQFGNRLLHVHGIGWHFYDGARWAFDDRGKARRAVHKIISRERKQADKLPTEEREKRARQIARFETAGAISGILTEAAALKVFAATVAELDADPFLLNVANGTLDLHTLELRPHAPADRITKVCRGAYQPGAGSAQWQAFLARVLPDEAVREFLQRNTGVGLLGKVVEHILLILTGIGANGKSIFYSSVNFALGDYACTAEPDLFMHRDGAHPTGEMDLRGVRWVTVSENDKGRRLAEATMKRLTGGDTVRARRMRQDFVEFTPSHTPVLITNHLPKVSGDDAAIWRRVRVVPFDVVIPEDEQDRKLDARLQLEADGILTWAVAGYRQYVERGLDEPDAVITATDNYQRNSDAVRRFIDEECVTSSAALQSTTNQLFEVWERWRVTDGAEPMSQKAFGQALDRHGYPVLRRTSGSRWRAGIACNVVQS
jgi:putative DNA primase/helicase